MMTTKEVAGIFNVRPDTVRRWCRQGTIRYYRASARGGRLFRTEDVAMAFLDRAIIRCVRGQIDEIKEQ